MADCVGCGYCCQKAQCVAGQNIYGLKDGVCTGLVWDEQAQRYWCLLIQETTGRAQEADKEGLAIGAGCSSSMFNTQREETIVRRKHARHSCIHGDLDGEEAGRVGHR